MEYTDLELNNKLALNEFNYDDLIPHRGGYLFPDENGQITVDGVNHSEFKPISSWNLLGPLMVKYKVELNFHDNLAECFLNDSVVDVNFKSESEIKRAIIMCILKSENII